MSMPAWPNDVPAVPNSDNGTFDPSIAFMQAASSSNFNFEQLPNQQQFQQRMQNGNVRHASPGFPNSVYQTQSIIPSKRSRAGGDSYGTSPRHTPGTLPASRSQTPQQVPYPGYHNNINGSQSVQTPTPYQHLHQGGSSNASPSPILQDQHFNAQNIPQRMSTASPSPFSPAMQSFVSQASPPQSDYGSRVDNLPNGMHPYPQGLPYAGAPMQHLTPPPGSTNPAIHGGMPSAYGHNPPDFRQQQRLYELRQHEMRQHEMRQQEMVRRLAATNNAAQNRHQGSNLNPTANSSNQMMNYQQATRTPQMQQPRGNSQEAIFQPVAQYMKQHGGHFNPQPIICGRPFGHVQMLFSMVVKQGGSKKVTAMGSWPAIAASLQFHPVQFPMAAQELQNYWNVNFGPWEQYWQQQQQQQQHQRQRSMNMQNSLPQQMQSESMGVARDPYSSLKQPGPYSQEVLSTMSAKRDPGNGYTTTVKQNEAQQNDLRQPSINGFPTPQSVPRHNQQQAAFGGPQPVLSLAPHITPPRNHRPPSQGRNSTDLKHSYSRNQSGVVEQNPFSSMPRQVKRSPIYQPVFRDLSNHRTEEGGVTHGGVNVRAFEKTIDDLEKFRPKVPSLMELGVVDLRALIMSLKCGIHAEVRLALDTLATLSVVSLENRQPAIEAFEDLIETLVDCADEQVDLLAENAAEVSDVMLISPYEDVVRGCRCELETLQDIREFGSLEYDLDRAVERLICITTILRNFSFFQSNHSLLVEPGVVRFMTTVIRYLGTRNMLLRTHRNTLDFAKDVVIYLSNLSDKIDLPGKEEALCILHFLLAFAPSPSPTAPGADTIIFSPYSPALNCYLPPAVDSLARLLARDEPNRTYYKSIFASDGASSPPYDLLTRTFALAIAPIPTHGSGILDTLKSRRPYLAQGLLAAEILVTLIPAAEHTLARSWLTSQDGFAPSLLRLVSLLGVERPPVPHLHPSTRQVVDPDPEAYGMITNRAIALLRKLAERAKDTDGPKGNLPIGILPKSSAVLEVLKAKKTDGNVVRQLCAFAEMEGRA